MDYGASMATAIKFTFELPFDVATFVETSCQIS